MKGKSLAAALIATGMLMAGGIAEAGEIGVRYESGTSTRNITSGERWNDYTRNESRTGEVTYVRNEIDADRYEVGSFDRGVEHSDAMALHERDESLLTNTNLFYGEYTNMINGTVNGEASIDIIVASLDVDGQVTIRNGYTISDSNDLFYSESSLRDLSEAEANSSWDREDGSFTDGSLATTTSTFVGTEEVNTVATGGSLEHYTGSDVTTFTSTSAFTR